MKALGSRARVLKHIYGVLAHGLRTDKQSVYPARPAESIEKVQTNNAALHPGMKITYVGWLMGTDQKGILTGR